jgi:dTDP-4-dehydrorhamnose reductase
MEHDLELFAELGLTNLRTCLHWEHFALSGTWADFDRCMHSAVRCGISPIVGLIHHGSGPPGTDLLDPNFPEKLAAYATEVARRYSWALDYTPVNEPQTTARFACLYGHWYPHHRDMRSYVRAFANQIKGIVLSMAAIRNVQPRARLIHTEDGGTTDASPILNSYRVEREHRRWLGLDLLCGRVDCRHPLYRFLIDNGLEEREILWFAEHPCPPSIIGMNYYVTSDRFLDHRVDLYPDFLGGGDSGEEPLVDIEAVRVSPNGIVGARTILTQAWERYNLPVAITEAHLGCYADQQVRWLAEMCRQAHQAYFEGVDVRAVTAWGLLGLYNWSHLCTRNSGAYEPGVFDVSSGTPIETPLSDLVRRLVRRLPVPSAALSSFGWWERNSRFTVQPALSRALQERN